MKKSVPKKNITSRIEDLRAPRRSEEHEPPSSPLKPEMLPRVFAQGEEGKKMMSDITQPHDRGAGLARKRIRPWTVLAIAAGFLVLGGMAFFLIGRAREDLLFSVGDGLNDFHEAVQSTDFSDLNAAKERFSKTAEDLEKTRAAMPLAALGDSFGELWPLLGRSARAFRGLQSLGGGLIAFISELDAIQGEAPDFIFSRRGEELIARVRRVRGIVSEIRKEESAIAALSSEFKGILPADTSFFLPFQLDLAP
ncbi:MAG: hypothetical protein AAB967_04380, partial [Patescibacteria group bacterium]